MAHDAHHVRGKKAFPALRWATFNGAALCRSCHLYAHSHSIDFRRWFARARPGDWAAITGVA
jgi:hypothetical protein